MKQQKGVVWLNLGRMKREEQKHTTDSNNAVFSSSHMRHLEKKEVKENTTLLRMRMINGSSLGEMDLKWFFVNETQ